MLFHTEFHLLQSVYQHFKQTTLKYKTGSIILFIFSYITKNDYFCKNTKLVILWN